MAEEGTAGEGREVLGYSRSYALKLGFERQLQFPAVHVRALSFCVTLSSVPFGLVCLPIFKKKIDFALCTR